MSDHLVMHFVVSLRPSCHSFCGCVRPCHSLSCVCQTILSFPLWCLSDFVVPFVVSVRWSCHLFCGVCHCCQVVVSVKPTDLLFGDVPPIGVLLHNLLHCSCTIFSASFIFVGYLCDPGQLYTESQVVICINARSWQPVYLSRLICSSHIALLRFIFTVLFMYAS